MKADPIEPIDIGERILCENEPRTDARDNHVLITAFPEDPSGEQIMRIVEVSGVLRFWDRPEEDIYTVDDGEPV